MENVTKTVIEGPLDKFLQLLKMAETGLTIKKFVYGIDTSFTLHLIMMYIHYTDDKNIVSYKLLLMNTLDTVGEVGLNLAIFPTNTNYLILKENIFFKYAYFCLLT